MLKLDLAMIIAPIDCITDIDYNYFTITNDAGCVIKEEFKQGSPSLLHIKLNHLHREIKIEFTAKILKDDYPELICKTNFKKCLSNINDLGICRLDIDRICNESCFCKIHVTQDVTYENDFKDLSKNIKSSISNYNKFKSWLMVNGNFIIEKNVVTKQRKKRLVMYEKSRELLLASNKSFLSAIKDKDRLLRYFNNKIRFELNLNAKATIRDSLNIPDTNIDTVLSATATPIIDFICDIFKEEKQEYKAHDKKEYQDMLVLADNDYDLEKVEAKMRHLCSAKTHISQIMKPYRSLMKKLDKTDSIPVKETLLNLLV